MKIKAKFASSCNECGGPIQIDDPIEWERGIRGARHAARETCEMFRTAAAARPAVQPLEIGGIVQFLQRAAEVLKSPKARFLSPEKKEMRLSIAGPRSRHVGSIQVTIAGTWVGNILTDGRPHGPIATQKDVLDLLVAIAEDPANAAAAYGAMMSRCSFCNLPLTDEGSVEVGYGPICAANWSLPWARFGVPELTPIPEVPAEAPAPPQNEREELVQLLMEKE